MRTIRWRNGQCPGRNGQWAERIAHAGSEAVRLVCLSPFPASLQLASCSCYLIIFLSGSAETALAREASARGATATPAEAEGPAVDEQQREPRQARQVRRAARAETDGARTRGAGLNDLIGHAGKPAESEPTVGEFQLPQQSGRCATLTSTTRRRTGWGYTWSRTCYSEPRGIDAHQRVHTLRR